MTVLPTPVGFDRLLQNLERFQNTVSANFASAFPPMNIRKNGDSNFVIELAAAGFEKSDIDITLDKDNVLTIKGNKTSRIEDADGYVYRGLANRNFNRSFQLAESLEIERVTLENGILLIYLVSVVSEEEPLKIEIE